MADSKTITLSPAATITMFCPTDNSEMLWTQYSRSWRCLNCTHRITLSTFFVEADAAFMLEIGRPLAKLHLTQPMLALARRTFVDAAGLDRCYVEVPWVLPVVAEATYDAPSELMRLLSEKPWAKREVA